MSIATGTTTTCRRRRRGATELDEELAHIRDLVILRDHFRRRGATADEIAEFEATIEQARTRLARLAGGAAEPHLAA